MTAALLRRFIFLAVFGGVFAWSDAAVLAPPPATATPNPTRIQQDLERKKKDLKEIERRLQQKKLEQVRAQTQEKNVLVRLDRMDRELERLDRESRVNAQDLDGTRGRINQLKDQTAETTLRLNQNREDLRRRLRTLYRAGDRGDLLSFWLGSKGIGELSPDLKFEMLLARSNEKLLNQTLEHQRYLSRSTRALGEEEGRRERILDALNRQKQGMEHQQGNRKMFLASLRKQQVMRDAAIQDLKEAGGELRQTVDRLLKQALEAQKAASWVSAGKGLGVLKGRIPWPVKGKILSPFGRYKSQEFNTTFENTGIQIQAPAGTPVRAIAQGRVRYSDWFKGFGKLVILDHGEGYYSLYAQASELAVSEGDRVVGGQVIASVGDTGSLVGNALYFELRKNGIPVNPTLWLTR